jgi:hypothetical protein
MKMKLLPSSRGKFGKSNVGLAELMSVCELPGKLVLKLLGLGT